MLYRLHRFSSSHRLHAFTLIEIMIVIGIIGLILTIAVPGWVRQRTVSQARACQQNLRTIDEAKELFCYAQGLDTGQSVTWGDLYISTNKEKSFLKFMPVCPAGGEYTLNPIGAFPACSLGSTTMLDGGDAAQHKIIGLSPESGS